ncbi:MAG: inositol-3-phosphate synthase [Planctomycetota bacterium]|nr:inositol-3-phosphate synthase [Planctomycetota bacterium]
MTTSSKRTGVWILGACGSVSTTTIVGTHALCAGLTDTTGLVTASPPFDKLDLLPLESIVFGGYDLSPRDLHERATELANAGIFPSALCPSLRDSLQEVSSNLLPAPMSPNNRSQSAAEAAAQVTTDLEQFQNRHDLDLVIVINLSSTEPSLDPHPALSAMKDLRPWLEQLPVENASPGIVYTLGAFDAGCPFINFTPSPGPEIPSLSELAIQNRLPHAGKDGKTGETLVKTCLAPLFLARNLKVLSWEGTNLLGGGDGHTLKDPDSCRTKTRSKDRALRTLLQDPSVHSGVHIHYVPSLSDWKTAWDFIHFEGFMGTRMTLQFTWQGCDSALAAPLVIDLIRLVHRAYQENLSGPLGHLAPFFKDPIGFSGHDFARQMDALYRSLLPPEPSPKRVP